MTSEEPTAVALQRTDVLVAAGYRVARGRHKDRISLHHPARRRRRGPPPSLLVYSDGLVATYPQENATRRRFAPRDEEGFGRFLAGVPQATHWELAAPYVERLAILFVLVGTASSVAWSVFAGQVAVISLIVHVALFSAPFVAIRLFLR